MMKKLLFTFITALIVVAGCRKSDSTDGTGKLTVRITDDPFNISYVESASVTITKIEIRKTGDSLANPFIVVSEVPVTIDLYKLRNGLTEELANLELPSGSYDLIRLYVDEASLRIKDQAETYHVKVPGGQQTGIKIFINPILHIEGGLTSELLLDFDLSKSFVMRGNMSYSAGVNGFIFKPCIRASNNSTAGRIEGYVMDTAMVKIANAMVWIKKDTIMATAFADTTGYYAFLGIPAGAYSLFATKEGYDTLNVNGVNVYAGNRTVQDFMLTKK